MIKNKPAITRSVFDKLVPEINGRVFTVSLIEDANVLQDIRDIIAELPQGGSWDELKGRIIEDLQAANEWFDDEKSAKRAELLLRTHGFQAYQAAAWNELDAQRDVFPYWQYLTMEDEAVREAHAALNGVVLPADHPFWQDHYPPWDWGCRCQVIGVSRMEYERIKGQDEGRDPDQKQIIEGERLKMLESQGVLARGPSSMVDVRSPKERYAERKSAGKNPPPPYQWTPGDLRIPLESLEANYADDPDTWKFFVDAAKGTALDDGRTLWEWLSSAAKTATAEGAAGGMALIAVNVAKRRLVDAGILMVSAAENVTEITESAVQRIEEASRFMRENNVPLPDHVAFDREWFAKTYKGTAKKHPAAFDHTTGKLMIQDDRFAKVSSSVIATNALSGRISTDHPSYIMIHEAAHEAYWKSGTTHYFDKLTSTERGFALNFVSDKAAEDVAEFVAEVYAATKTGKTFAEASRIMEIYKKYGGL